MAADAGCAGVGAGIFEPVVTSFIMGSVPADRLGTASASLATARHIAYAVGVAVAGAILAVRQRVYLAELATAGVVAEAAQAEAIARAFADTQRAGVILSAVTAVLSLAARPAERPAVKGHVSGG
jgi:stage V sporulation protein SpoVS